MTEIPDANQPLAGPEDAVAFVLGGREVSVGEIVRAAHFRGEARAHWLDLLAKLACDDHASSRDLEPDGAALQARADRFRYERDLITAEETERWLELRGLTPDDFTAHILRGYWKEALGKEIAPGADDFSTAGPVRRAQLTVEMLLTGAFDRMARDLGWRLAALRSGDASADGLAKRIAAERIRFFARTNLNPNELASWLEAVGGDEAWLEEMLALEAAYGERCAAILTPERLAQALRSQRLALMRFEVDEMEFDTMDAAHEAVMCIRGDGLSMEEVARESRYPYAQRDLVQEDLPEAWQMPFLSTPEGGLVGPLADWAA